MNGTLTEKENVADIGGLSIAFRAYKKQRARSQPEQAIPGIAKFTDEQLFFLGHAQVNCELPNASYLSIELSQSNN